MKSILKLSLSTLTIKIRIKEKARKIFMNQLKKFQLKVLVKIKLV